MGIDRSSATNNKWVDGCWRDAMWSINRAVWIASFATVSQTTWAACLSPEYNGIQDHWVNQCPVPVSVNWSDAGACKNWSCNATVPAKGRQDANKFTGQVIWCEC